MDSKKSSVTAASKKMYKTVLPRATDLVSDLLAMLASANSPDEVEVFICDAEDAFWQVLLHPSERRFYCALLRRPDGTVRYLCFTRTAQGSRGAPLSWATIFGLVCRCAFSVVRLPGTSDTERLQVYVDDPAMVVKGTKAFRRNQVTLMMLAWRLLGIALAIKKGQLGPIVDWVGITFPSIAGESLLPYSNLAWTKSANSPMTSPGGTSPA